MQRYGKCKGPEAWQAWWIEEGHCYRVKRKGGGSDLLRFGRLSPGLGLFLWGKAVRGF
jgi:hypothetical protein